MHVYIERRGTLVPVIGEAFYFFDSLDRTKGLAWTADRRLVELGDNVQPRAINASGVIVGNMRSGGPVKVEF
jgi:hypothetical protein